MGRADGELAVNATVYTVEFRGLPLELIQAARDQWEALQREFALIELGSDTSDAPTLLLRLARELRDLYGDYTASADDRVTAAIARGDTTIDVTLEVPAGAADAARELRQCLDDVDRFSKDGQLLTPETPEPIRSFRQWYLGEFVRQIGGEPPIAWVAPRP
jgi:hypothetical protein